MNIAATPATAPATQTAFEPLETALRRLVVRDAAVAANAAGETTATRSERKGLRLDVSV